jgi:predicted N-acetyltransferase YhbS
MTANFRIRPYVDTDVAQILAVIQSAFAEHRGKLVPPSSAEHKTVDIVREELREADAFVAEAGGRLVGCVFYRPRDGSMYLDRLAVLPAMQGRGIASALIGQVEDAARARGIGALTLTVRLALTRQQAMYRKLGFEFLDYGTHEGFSEPTSMKMRKTFGVAGSATG